jgi:hypothetical protein
MDKNQLQVLRDLWNEQAKGLHKGGTPILTAGLKVQPWAESGKDAATAEMLKLSNEHIALAFSIPLQILGIGGSPFSSTELLMQRWVASGLGFALNHIEEAFGLLFNLTGQPDEYVEFDTAALLRSAMKDRIDSLARGVQGGIYSPNEARNMEGLESVEFGDEPRVQQQVVPLSQIGKMPAAPAPPPPTAPDPAPKPSASEVQAQAMIAELRTGIAEFQRMVADRIEANRLEAARNDETGPTDENGENARLPPELAEQIASATRQLHELPPLGEIAPPPRVTRIERDESGAFVPVYE